MGQDDVVHPSHTGFTVTLDPSCSGAPADPVLEALISQLLQWIGVPGRAYAEVMEAWRTSCPRLPVWEEANRRGLVSEARREGTGLVVVVVTAAGLDWLVSAQGDVGRPISDRPGPAQPAGGSRSG